ncbi:MAG TPA: mechanosensitive ion channel family protein [Gaiellaceae bacterium]|nr:mechanosensitive ion channel family protein [Gaiellaceae bacterium]
MRERLRRVAPAVCLVLLLGGGTARAQTPTPTTDTTAPPATEPARSPLELGADVPRGAVARFFAAAREGQYARAAEHLNLRQIPRAARARRGPELARELEAVLERALWIDLQRVSDQPEGDPDDGLPPLVDSLGTIETDGGPVEILLERVSQPSGAPVWKFAAGTVSAIPALYEQYGWGPLARILPAPFFELRFLQVRLWQWIALVLLSVLAWLVARLLWRPITALTRRAIVAGTTADGAMAEQLAAPLAFLVALAVFASGLKMLGLAVPAHRLFAAVTKALAIVGFTWLVLRALDVFAIRFERRLGAQRHMRAAAAVPLGRRTLKVFLALIAFTAALQNFGFNVTGLIAGLGVGGLALALAAQKTVENLFGSVSLVADQPVRVGDVCRFGDTVGTVEDIGLRSTRVRTVDRTIVTVPNAQFSTLALENLSRRDRIPIRATLTLPQGTTPERVRTVLGALRDMARRTPKVEERSARARFMRMGSQALEIELFAYVLTDDWDEFVDIREQVLLGALDVVGAEAKIG